MTGLVIPGASYGLAGLAVFKRGAGKVRGEDRIKGARRVGFEARKRTVKTVGYGDVRGALAGCHLRPSLGPQGFQTPRSAGRRHERR